MRQETQQATRIKVGLSSRTVILCIIGFSIAAGVVMGGLVFPAKNETATTVNSQAGASLPVLITHTPDTVIPGRVLVKFSVPEGDRQAIIDRVVETPQDVVREKSSNRVISSDDPQVRLRPYRYSKTEVALRFASRARVFSDAAIPGSVNEIIARRNKSDADLQQALEKLGTDQWEVITVNTDADVAELALRFRKSEGVAAAQPDNVISLMLRDVPQEPSPGGGSSTRPNDPYYRTSRTWGNSYRDLWGLQRISSEAAWRVTRGSTDIVVAVPDTGIDYTHPDLEGQLWNNPGEIPDNHFDDDGNGFIDDVRGWNFTSNSNDPMDDFGHGTHIAGTIGAMTNNAQGVAGINWRVQLMAVKVFDEDGGSDSLWIANALRYAAENGADVINMSWGNPYCPGVAENRDCEPLIYDAIGYLHSLGVVGIASAGNSNTNVRFTYPASDSRVITVGAWSWDDERAPFSNWGEELDVTAPGVEILSLRAANTDMYLGSPGYIQGSRIVPPCADQSGNPGACPENKYYRANGTSMAAPHGTGVAALVLARHPSFTLDDVRHVLRASADDVAPAETDLYSGTGVLRADRALAINNPLTAKILAPANEAIVSQQTGTVAVAGTAAGSVFQSYSLAYGAGIYPASYATITTGFAPVQNGALGQWSIGELPDGPYTLQLTATSTEGFSFRDFVFIDLERTTPAQLSTANPPFDAYVPHISGNRIVWQMFYWDGEVHSEIYLYDLGPDSRYGTSDCYPDGVCEGRHLLATPQDSIFLAFAGNIIVWHSSSQNAIKMCLYNETTGLCPTYPLNAIPASMEGEMAIDGSRIVWTDSVYGNSHIHLYELGPDHVPETGDCYPGGVCEGYRLVTAAPLPYPHFLSISGTYLTYSDAVFPQPYEIYLHDLSSGTTRRLTNAGTDQELATIEGNRLAWLSFNADFTQADVRTCVYDANQGTCPAETVSSNAGHFSTVHFSGPSIVWDHDPSFPLGLMDIFLHNLDTQSSQTLIGPIHSRQLEPRASRTNAVWRDDRSGRFEVMMRELPAQGGGGQSPVFLKVDVKTDFEAPVPP